MAAYIGVNGKARKVKNLYVGVNGKARKVKKAYIGVGGKARLFYTSGPELPTYNWKATSVGLSADWFDIAFGAGVFIAIANGSSKAARSTDGKTWTLFTIPGGGSYNYWYNIIYAGGKFVAVGTDISAYSTDGINWTAGGSIIFSNGDSNIGLVYDGTQYITANNANNGKRGIGKSSNIQTWSKSYVSATDNSGPHRLFYIDGLFIITSFLGSQYGYLYSYDAITWYSVSGYRYTLQPISSNNKIFWIDRSSGSSVSGKILSLDSSRNTKAGPFVGSDYVTLGVMQIEDSTLVLCASNSEVAIADFEGGSKELSTLPVSQSYSRAAYGNGRWVLIAQNTSTFVYSE